MKVIQAKLQQDGKEMTAWIDKTKKLKVGNRITLKGQTGWWKVLALYDLTRESADIHTDWNNNI